MLKHMNGTVIPGPYAGRPCDWIPTSGYAR
jgi:hypothetical protein